MTRKNVTICDGCHKIIDEDSDKWLHVEYDFKPACKFENPHIAVDFCETCAHDKNVILKGAYL